MYEDLAFDMTDLLQTAEHFVLDVLILHAPGRNGADWAHRARLRRRRAASGISGISTPGWSIWASGRMCR